MGDLEDRIWQHAKKYRNVDSNAHRFARFLFVDVSDLDEEMIRKINEADENVLTMPCMQDKPHVFDVVYDRTAHQLGSPLRVTDKDRYLSFSHVPDS